MYQNEKIPKGIKKRDIYSRKKIKNLCNRIECKRIDLKLKRRRNLQCHAGGERVPEGRYAEAQLFLPWERQKECKEAPSYGRSLGDVELINRRRGCVSDGGRRGTKMKGEEKTASEWEGVAENTKEERGDWWRRRAKEMVGTGSWLSRRRLFVCLSADDERRFYSPSRVVASPLGNERKGFSMPNGSHFLFFFSVPNGSHFSSFFFIFFLLIQISNGSHF